MTAPNSRLTLLAVITLVTSCAKTGVGKVTMTPCTISAADLALVQGAPLYPECAVERKAARLPLTMHPDFRPSAPPRNATCFSSDIELVVDSLGRPEVATARIVRTNDQAWADAVLATVPTWKFVPAIRENRPVRQIYKAHEQAAVITIAVPAGGTPIPPRQRPPSC